MDNFVAARRRWRWLVQGPEHRYRERKEDDECQGNVAVLAHGAGVPAPNFEGKRRPILGDQHSNRNAPQTRGLWVPIRARVRAGDCSHGNDRRGSPALLIPTSVSIFCAQHFA